MDKTFRAFDPEQGLLLPPSLDDWLPPEHLARFVAELVDEHLDLSRIHAVYTEGRGGPPYDPRLMVRILLYGYTTGVRSSRRLEAACVDVVAFRWLAAGVAPDYRAIARFRKRHLSALGHLFVQALALCQAAGMVSLGQVALDGTKVRANASRRKAMSYARMSEKEKVLAEEVSALLADAERIDKNEDKKFGKNRRGDDVETVAAKGQAAANEAVPKPKAQRNFTDPDSKIMLTSDGAFHQCYNAQAVVDADHQVIVATEVDICAADVGNLIAMTGKTVANTGWAPGQMLADAGYCSADNLDAAERFTDTCGTEFFVATGRLRRGDRPPVAPRGRIPSTATGKQRMARKLTTKKGQAAYARRKVIVEPVFGQMHTLQNAKHLLLRGLAQARGEWLLLAACHNLRKLHGHIGVSGLTGLAIS